MQMGITEYLIHMSKVNCDFKAIKNAIISSHDEVDLEIDFLPVSETIDAIRFFLLMSFLFELLISFQAELDNLEVIQIPVKEILLRLRQNSNLFDILSIRNKRFQRSNVLGESHRDTLHTCTLYGSCERFPLIYFRFEHITGQVVNAVRKFRNKHLDSLKDVYITVPQYYRSGYLSIARK